MIDISSPYIIVTALSIVVILSYFFNILSKKTNVPAVLMLIVTGLIVQQLLSYTDQIDTEDLMPILEILGIVGLIMIVLEAALDLKLTRDKAGLIVRSLIVALLGFALTTIAITFIIEYFTESSLRQALFYAMPMSILSSAIVIPSISSLSEERREFLIYESTFSDIFGIMGFYLAIEFLKADTNAELAQSFAWNVGATIVISLILSYVLVWLFQKINTQIKLFLLISVLIVLYAVGKMLHLSSLLIILNFGLILNNTNIFFKGRLASWVQPESVKRILHEFHLITIETAFVVRTFFFVVFGATIALASLFNIVVFLESVTILAVIFILRWVLLIALWKRPIKTELGIAPRGLITILLFFAIPEEYEIPEFDSGILLYIILVTSILMTWSLIANTKTDLYDNLIDEEITSFNESDSPSDTSGLDNASEESKQLD